MFNVTEMTIRRDLDQLAEQHDIERTRGGAIRSESTLYTETRLEHRMKLHSEQKLKIGGEISRTTQASRGTLSEEMLKLFRLDVAFLGANSIELDGKIYTANVNETGLKKTAMKSAKKVYIVADSSKLNSSKIISYASLSETDGLITDDEISEKNLHLLKESGANIIISK